MANMLTNIKNSIYLLFWKSKMGGVRTPYGRFKIKRSYDSFYATVYDIRWSVSLLGKDNKVLAKRTIYERTDKRHVVSTIRHIEKSTLAKVMHDMAKEHT